MFDGPFVFSQLMDFLPRRDFNACVGRYGDDRRQRGFSCRDQFLCLGFAQLTFRESLRDVEICLRALGPKLYHAGFRGKVSRSTLADANRAHDWRIYADFAQVLIRRARQLYAHVSLAVDLEQTVYALDSTTIDLCRRWLSGPTKMADRATIPRKARTGRWWAKGRTPPQELCGSR